MYLRLPLEGVSSDAQQTLDFAVLEGLDSMTPVVVEVVPMFPTRRIAPCMLDLSCCWIGPLADSWTGGSREQAIDSKI